MRKSGPGQRWSSMEDASLQRHTVVPPRAEKASLVQTFEYPNVPRFSVNLTLLSSRPELARILANTFWAVYQSGRRRATAIRTADALKLFARFLNYRSQGQSDIIRGPEMAEGAVSMADARKPKILIVEDEPSGVTQKRPYGVT